MQPRVLQNCDESGCNFHSCRSGSSDVISLLLPGQETGTAKLETALVGKSPSNATKIIDAHPYQYHLCL